MVGAELDVIVSGLLKLALLAGGAIYAGLVVMSYRNDAAPSRPQVGWHDPARAAERWGVFLGVRALAVPVRAGSYVFGMLAEASADVGDWFLSHRHHESQ